MLYHDKNLKAKYRNLFGKVKPKMIGFPKSYFFTFDPLKPLTSKSILKVLINNLSVEDKDENRFQ